MNMLQNLDAGMLYRKIRTKLNGKSSRINQGRIDEVFYHLTPHNLVLANDVVANKPYSSNLDSDL